MKVAFIPVKVLLSLVTLCCLFTSQAQSDIKFHGLHINTLDKQQRKQGNWVFFNPLGLPVMSCVYKDDSCNSPIIFYENGDTAFVRLPRTDSIEPFILYAGKKQYFGNFIYTADTAIRTILEQDATIDNTVINKAVKFKDIVIEPVFFFAQKKWIDFVSSGFTSSNMNFNKPINVVLTISSAGLVTKVDFPADKNNLSPDEETELRWIYSRAQRWQPYFSGNKVRAAKISISNNSRLSYNSY